MSGMSPERVAEVLSEGGHTISERWVREQLNAGRLRGSRVGRRWFVPADAIDELMSANTNQVAPRKRRRRDIPGGAA